MVMVMVGSAVVGRVRVGVRCAYVVMVPRMVVVENGGVNDETVSTE